MIPQGGLLGSAILWLGCFSAAGAGRFEELTKKFEKPADPARVIASTYLGTPGTEWLAAGAIEKNGTILLGGVSLGPTLEFGPKATVFGNDGSIQAPIRVYKRRMGGGREVDKSGQPVYEPFTWKHANATAFLLRLSADTKEIQAVSRLGWKLGSLTSLALDQHGNIYFCGPGTFAVNSISTNAESALISKFTVGRYSAQRVYLAKMSSDLSRIDWVRVVQGPSFAPLVEVTADDRIRFFGPDLRIYNPDGKLLSTTPIPGGLGAKVSFSPVDGTIARGGEQHSSTGREPYRNPMLDLYRADGSLLYQLYNWDGPLVGLNHFRLTSDSAIRGVWHDPQGNLLLSAWSDGGNSVFSREPTDLSTPVEQMNRLGFSTTGAGVLNCSYLIKLNKETFKVEAATPWVGYLKDQDKPSSAKINALALAPDGSVCLAGNSGQGLIQTGNALATEPIGNYAAVLSADLSSIRFSSSLPACGLNEVNDSNVDGSDWGIVTGTLQGKPVAMFLSGAIDKDNDKPAPMVNARQPAFGGGFADGHLLLLDLSKP